MKLTRLARVSVMVAVPLALMITAVPAADAKGKPGGGDPSAPFTKVTGDLRNPRGIALSADGKLYVAEAGDVATVCFPEIQTEEGLPLCGGNSSRVSRIDTASGKRFDYIKGLATFGGPLFAIGATGVAVQGNQVFAMLGANDQGMPPSAACGDTPECTAFLAMAAKQLGHVLRGVVPGHYSWRQDVGASNFNWTVANKATIGAGDPSYQPGWANNPDFQPGDANPYAMASAPGGNYMVDGGSNTLTWIPNIGKPKVIAALPNPTGAQPNAYDAVPTCVAPLGGHKVFMADLNGDVFVSNGSSLTLHPSALTSVGGGMLVAAGGCAYDGKGSVYVTDIFAGSVVKITLSTMSISFVRAPGTFNFPSGVALDRRGNLFLSNNSVCPSFATPVDPQNPCGGVTGEIDRFHL